MGTESNQPVVYQSDADEHLWKLPPRNCHLRPEEPRTTRRFQSHLLRQLVRRRGRLWPQGGCPTPNRIATSNDHSPPQSPTVPTNRANGPCYPVRIIWSCRTA